ncbi:hypothetical protein ABFS82_13G010300 [Erythranthe guttata]|uniref:transcription factor PIF4 n=1 Tax=Erythranthe guttata TaxID=4155 RepID=UPI00064D9988|nr:PREDICTED: transcription factor PIF4 [Erythranthe guttata]|eukprot:XP_012830904.1 PREDICTED: transcription factor PIF4 [Erythranthe guttata]
MESCLIPDWNTEVGVEFPTSIQRKSLGIDSDLMELLWQNGELVLHSQTNHRKIINDDPSYKSKQSHNTNNRVSTSGATEISNTFIQDDETSSWIDCPIDESFEKEFCANFLSDGIPLQCENVLFSPPPRFESFNNSNSNNNSNCNNQEMHVQKRRAENGGVPECSGRTFGSSHCASNQVVDKVKSSESMERETIGQAIASCSGGSGNSSFWKTSSPCSNDTTNGHKRKSRDVEESECRSDATELESGSGNKSRTNRRTRVAEVHNLSERRRRDRINEKMKALQELIPHSNKSDKASMLDEAIEYMKSLQLQLQLMWMGSGMGQMMLPGLQQYMSRAGMGVGPQMYPAHVAVQNLVRLSRSPLVHQAMNIASNQNQGPMGPSHVVGPVNYPNHMQNSGFHEQYANYMGFHSTPNASQPMNMFNFGFHSAQQNQVSAPPANGNEAI